MVVSTLQASNSAAGDKGDFVPPSNRGFAVSGAQKIPKNEIFVRKDATPELDFAAEKSRFRHKIGSNETALKVRKKSFSEAVREGPKRPKSRESEGKCGLSNVCFESNSAVRHG